MNISYAMEILTYENYVRVATINLSLLTLKENQRESLRIDLSNPNAHSDRVIPTEDIWPMLARCASIGTESPIVTAAHHLTSDIFQTSYSKEGRMKSCTKMYRKFQNICRKSIQGTTHKILTSQQWYHLRSNIHWKFQNAVFRRNVYVLSISIHIIIIIDVTTSLLHNSNFDKYAYILVNCQLSISSKVQIDRNHNNKNVTISIYIRSFFFILLVYVHEKYIYS